MPINPINSTNPNLSILPDLMEFPESVFGIIPPTEERLQLMQSFNQFHMELFKLSIAQATIARTRLSPTDNTLYEFARQDAIIEVFQDLYLLASVQLNSTNESGE